MMKDKYREIKEHEIPMNVTTKFETLFLITATKSD